jgi:hypothetical protein
MHCVFFFLSLLFQLLAQLLLLVFFFFNLYHPFAVPVRLPSFVGQVQCMPSNPSTAKREKKKRRTEHLIANLRRGAERPASGGKWLKRSSVATRIIRRYFTCSVPSASWLQRQDQIRVSAAPSLLHFFVSINYRTRLTLIGLISAHPWLGKQTAGGGAR